MPEAVGVAASHARGRNCFCSLLLLLRLLPLLLLQLLVRSLPPLVGADRAAGCHS